MGTCHGTSSYLKAVGVMIMSGVRIILFLSFTVKLRKGNGANYGGACKWEMGLMIRLSERLFTLISLCIVWVHIFVKILNYHVRSTAYN